MSYNRVLSLRKHITFLFAISSYFPFRHSSNIHNKLSYKMCTSETVGLAPMHMNLMKDRAVLLDKACLIYVQINRDFFCFVFGFATTSLLLTGK
jgi:hypothetical protein